MKPCLLVLTFLFAFTAAADVRICTLETGEQIWVDNTGQVPVSTQFQRCVQDRGVQDMALPPGTYLVDAPIVVRNRAADPLIIHTAGLVGDTRNCQQLGMAACAKFLASSSDAHCINNPAHCVGKPSDKEGMLQAKSVTGVKFDHLVFDGNLGNRLNTTAKDLCEDGLNRYGFNSRMAACTNCEYTYNFTRRALCGTGLEFEGTNGRVQGNAAFDNGHRTATGQQVYRLWADGITIARNDGGIVNDNRLYNNTDVGLIVGGMKNGYIQSNWIQQNGVYAFAGLMLGNFAEALPPGSIGDPAAGDYTNTFIRYNTIQCYSFWCGFGLNMGPDPWVADNNRLNIRGGLVTRNNISGARVLINFGGAGESTNKTTVTNNTLSGAPTVPMLLRDNLPTPCTARPNVLQNLPNNNTSGLCGNHAVADPIATSYECFRGCWPPPQ